MAQVGFSLPLIERLSREFPKTVVGLKDTSGDWSNTKAILDAFPGFEVFPGSEAFLLDGLRNGAAGCISATANVVGEVDPQCVRQLAGAGCRQAARRDLGAAQGDPGAIR